MARPLSAAAAILLVCSGCAAAPPPAVTPAPVVVGSVAPRDSELPGLAAAAAGGDGTAVARLRLAGPKGLDALLALDDATPAADARRRAVLADALDVVAKQKDARASRLYWYTDIEDAKRAAHASGRPILSLRLLGQLDDELSCANSRFFRTTLYPNREVNAVLREKFVLHWSSERPAPVVTIDFRDGRKIQRTVTGNSLHYVLDAEGHVVDAIPGLLGARPFARALEQAAPVAREVATLADGPRAERLERYHEQALADLRAAWPRELARAAVPPARFPGDAFLAATPPPPSVARPALVAMDVAPSKAAVERPMLARTMAPVAPPELAAFADAVPWQRLAAAHVDECRLDIPSVAMIRAKNPRSWAGSAVGRPVSAAELAELVQSFEASVAEDTVKNTYLHHAVLHGWLLEAARARSGADGFALLNARVYAEMFRTPASDPWLGLVPPSAFSGIKDDGIVTP